MALRHAFHSSIMAPFIGSKFQNHVFLAELRKNIGYTKKNAIALVAWQGGVEYRKKSPFSIWTKHWAMLVEQGFSPIPHGTEVPSENWRYISSCNNHVGVQQNHEGHQFCVVRSRLPKIILINVMTPKSFSDQMYTCDFKRSPPKR